MKDNSSQNFVTQNRHCSTIFKEHQGKNERFQLYGSDNDIAINKSQINTSRNDDNNTNDDNDRVLKVVQYEEPQCDKETLHIPNTILASIKAMNVITNQ